jgi:tetratricopeptide (TPR) repeat protein
MTSRKRSGWRRNRPGRLYLYLAIRSLVAAGQWQEAFDLVKLKSTPEVSTRSAAFAELTRALVKAGQKDRFQVLYMQMPMPPPDPNLVFREYVRALADEGKIDDAVAAIGELRGRLSGFSTADMLILVAQAYAKRGDTKRADEFFDKAQATLQAGLQKPAASGPLQQDDPISLRYALISLSALRGDTAGVKTALQQLPSGPRALPPPGPDRVAEAFRMQGQRRVSQALAQKKQYELALEVARSITFSTFDRDQAVAFVASSYAADGRIDDARAVLSSLGDETKPKTWTNVVGGLAVALAKAGNVALALQTAEQIGDPLGRRGAVFAIGQTLPQ